MIDLREGVSDSSQSNPLDIFPFEAVELLNSKLCHDLISPVSAIGNGIELLSEDNEQMRAQALDLVGQCAGQALDKLQFFRAAYGRGGVGDGISDLSDIRRLAANFFAPGAAALVWSDGDVIADRPLSRLSVKLVLNMLLLSNDALPLGGEIIFRFRPGAMGLWGECVAAGKRIKFSDQAQAALTGTLPVHELTPETIQAYFVGRLSRFARSGLETARTQGAGDRQGGCLTFVGQLS